MDDASRYWDILCAKQDEYERHRIREMAERYCLELPLTCGMCWWYCNYPHRTDDFECTGVCVTVKDDMPVLIVGTDSKTPACSDFCPIDGE